MRNYFRNGLKDFLASLVSWRIWYILALNDVKRRYRRSKLGQFWLTLSMAATIGGLGVVYSSIFKTNVEEYLPYISVTFVFWAIISGGILESCNAFIDCDAMIRHTTIPKATYLLRVQFRLFMIGIHNIVIIPIVFLIFQFPINLNILLFIPGFILVLFNLFWIGYFLAIISARFRDVPQIISSLMQVIFFITPVMFRPHQLGRNETVILFNPFAHLLAIVRDPLLGSAPAPISWVVCIGLALIGMIYIFPFAGRHAPRVVYWL